MTVESSLVGQSNQDATRAKIADVLAQYSLQVIRDESGLQRLGYDWSLLYQRACPKNLFLSIEWLSAWWRHFQSNSVPFLVTAWHDEKLVAAAPLRIEKRWFGRVLRFIGDHRSDYLGFLISPDHEIARRLVLDEIFKHSAEWDLLLLRQLCGEYIDVNSIHAARGFRRVEIEASKAPYFASSGSWNELQKRGPSQLRQMRRKSRSFAKNGGEVERFAGKRAAETASKIISVESRSWKYGTRAACYQTDKDQGMLREYLTTLGKRGEVEVWIAWVGDLPIAYLLNFLTPQRTCYYQGAYDADFGRFSPGGLLQYHAFERTWQDGVREYDFMNGDHSWKSRWTNGQRKIRHVAIYPRSLRGTFAFLVLLAPKWYLKKNRFARAVYQTLQDVARTIRRLRTK